uniref:Zn(2)-C6 fungal-type domain-containing protein n=2 Tax=Chrysotila carterae TaxID=13221 RepID=A0A7S4BMC8_CHRCT|mmetsp:Transcript_34648/g.76179  ORF Transcript_34648/g.76179 Transcript_34648/m.76179 type:complete len:504 (-) Transcript_34648:523-2034(-)
MAPAQAACKACRQSKTKCDLLTLAPEKCSRCSRIGLVCIPCGPSRRGQSHPNRVIAKLGSANRALLEVQPNYTRKGSPSGSSSGGGGSKMGSPEMHGAGGGARVGSLSLGGVAEECAACEKDAPSVDTHDIQLQASAAAHAVGAPEGAAVLRADPGVFTYAMSTSGAVPASVLPSLSAAYEMDPSKGLSWKDLDCKHYKKLEECVVCKCVRNLVNGWASVAGKRNSHTLLMTSLKLAARCQIPVMSVMDPKHGAQLPLLELSSKCPPPIAELLGSGGYCWARGVLNDSALGQVGGFITNTAFNEVVADPTELAEAWRQSGGGNSLVERFLHPDDVSIFAELFDVLASKPDALDGGSLLHAEDSRPVRLLDRRIGDHVQCTARLVVLADENAFWMATKFTLDEPDLYVIAAETQLSALSDLAAAPSFGTAVEQPDAMELTTEELCSMIAEVENSMDRSNRMSRNSSGEARMEENGNVMWSYDELTKEMRSSMDNSRGLSSDQHE